MKRKRTETFVETHERFTVFQNWFPKPSLCSECLDGTTLVAPETAAVLSRVSTRAIFSLVEAKQIHFRETDEGLVMVCLPSLMAVAKTVEAEKVCPPNDDHNPHSYGRAGSNDGTQRYQ